MDIISKITPEWLEQTSTLVIAAVSAIGGAVAAIVAVWRKLRELRGLLHDTTTALDVVTDVVESSDNGAPQSVVAEIKRRVEATAAENDAEQNHQRKPLSVIIDESAQRAADRARP